MDELFPVLVAILVAASLLAAIVAGITRKRSLDDVYRRLARHYGGAMREAGWFAYSSTRFTHRGAWVTVEPYSTGGEHSQDYTQVHVSWPDGRLRCEIRPHGILTGIGKFLGMQDIEVGSRWFDDLFLVTGNDDDAIRRLLTPDVQIRIEHLRRLHSHGDIYIRISGGVLLVKTKNIIREYAQLQQYVSLCLDLYDAALAISDEGIAFLDESPLEPQSSEAICQICGDRAEREVVVCRACKTPHHRDCWQYYGACSTYGCGEKRYVQSK